MTAIAKMCVCPIRAPKKHRIAKPQTTITPANARKNRAAKASNASGTNASPAKKAQHATAKAAKSSTVRANAFVPKS